MITLSLAKNDLKTLAPIASLPEFLPNLKVRIENALMSISDLIWSAEPLFARQ